ncbi:adenylyltransferase/cytidyltransferase family protein [Sphingobacterium sp. SGL-16]|nr:adenylyltransferase/cytidyltransferase family protein [Sphingobacterium sp. SGL-16]
MLVDKQVHFHVIPRYCNEKRFLNNIYTDVYWPNPVDITNYIEEEGLEIKVLNYLNNISSKKLPIIGYTTGVYDLFHIGHLNLLKKAKEQCDYLIVGVTTDELSLKRKGKIPIIPLSERMQIINNLSVVDEVVIQEHMDKFAAWKRYKFHKMFVGSDWKGSDKWNEIEKIFSSVGTEIVYFPYTESTSSTLLRTVLTDKVK